MSLIKFGKLNGDNCYDGGECTNLTITCPDELDNKNMLHQLKYQTKKYPPNLHDFSSLI